jgi:hypothetical protein
LNEIYFKNMFYFPDYAHINIQIGPHSFVFFSLDYVG